MSTLGSLTPLMTAVTLFVSVASVLVAAGSGSGKLAGRGAVLVAAILVGLAVSLLAALALFDTVSLVDYALFAALTLLFALSYVGIVVGLSATAATTGRAFAYGVGAFVTLELLSDLLPTAALLLTNGFSLAGVTTVPDWIVLLDVLVPSGAYTNAVSWFLGGTSLTGAASLVVLGAWLAFPVGLGYRRFARADR